MGAGPFLVRGLAGDGTPRSTPSDPPPTLVTGTLVRTVLETDLGELAVHPKDENVIATGDFDGSLRLWHVDSGKQFGPTMRDGDFSAFAIDFSPDGDMLAAAGYDGAVRLWDVRTGRMLGKPLTGHEGSVWSVRFARSGRWVASGGQDGRVMLWDVERRRHFVTFTGHTDDVQEVLWDRVSLLSVSSDGTMRNWAYSEWDYTGRYADPAKWTELSRPSAATSGLTCVAMNVDRNLTAAGTVDGDIRTWRGSNLELEGDTVRAHPVGLTALRYSGDGDMLASAGGVPEPEIRLWDTSTWEQIAAPLTGHAAAAITLRFRDRDRELLSASDDNRVLLWRLER